MPALFVDLDGVLMVTPQTTNPLAPILTWNIGELCSVIWYSVKLLAPLAWMSAGLEPPLPLASQKDDELPTLGSPPCPSMMPPPTIPELAPFAVMSAPAPL